MRTQNTNARPNITANGTPLFCDLYHLTMAQAWFADGKAEKTKTSEAFFRKCPFGGSYLLAAGLAEFAEWLKNWHFGKEDIDYLRTIKNPDGGRKFNDEFLAFLEGQKLNINIRAVREGEIVFPNEPVYSVTSPCWQVDMVEAALLNIFNSQSLIATKASRMAHAASLDGKNARCWNLASDARRNSDVFRKPALLLSAGRQELPTWRRQNIMTFPQAAQWRILSL